MHCDLVIFSKFSGSCHQLSKFDGVFAWIFNLLSFACFLLKAHFKLVKRFFFFKKK